MNFEGYESNQQFDALKHLFDMQHKFMSYLKSVDVSEVPDWPIDFADKKSQRACRDFALRATEELFEAISMLKKWKGHRVINQTEFDQDGFLEEIVDSLHYIIEVMILMGVSSEQLHESFKKKHEINMNRVSELASKLQS